MIQNIEEKLTITLTNRVNEVLLQVERNTETNLIKIQKKKSKTYCSGKRKMQSTVKLQTYNPKMISR